MQFLRELYCWYEYEQDDNGKMNKVSRKCLKNLNKILATPL